MPYPMPRSLFLTLAVSSVLGLLLAAGGCTSDGNAAKTTGHPSHASHAGHGGGGGVMCPKCETVWTREGTPGGGGRITMMQAKPTMACPDCDAMAKSQLTGDGKVMLHECATCKVTPKVIAPAGKTMQGRGGVTG